jgi:hypothetical protein
MQIREIPIIFLGFFFLLAFIAAPSAKNTTNVNFDDFFDLIASSSDTWPTAYVKFLESIKAIVVKHFIPISLSDYFYRNHLFLEESEPNSILLDIPGISKNPGFKQDLILQYLTCQQMHMFLWRKSLIRQRSFISTLIDSPLEEFDWKFMALLALELQEFQVQLQNRILTFPQLQLLLTRYFYLEKKLYLFDEKIPKLWNLDGLTFRVAAPHIPYMILLNALNNRLKQIKESLESIYIFLPFHFEWLLIEQGQFVVVTPTPMKLEIGETDRKAISLFPWGFFWNRSRQVNPKSYFSKQSEWLAMDNNEIFEPGLHLVTFKILPMIEAIDLLELDEFAHQDFYPFVISLMYLLMAFESFIEGKISDKGALRTKDYFLCLYQSLKRVHQVHNRFIQKALFKVKVLCITAKVFPEKDYVDCGSALVRFHLIESIKSMPTMVTIHEEILKGGKLVLHLSVSNKVTDIIPLATYVKEFIRKRGLKATDLKRALHAHFLSINLIKKFEK